MRVLAPAKINLHLRVGPRRADGFHPLLSWMCTVGLFDTLILERARAVQGDALQQGIALTCDDASLACDEGNLVVRAGNALAEALAESREGKSADLGGVRVALQKRIPVGSGLGGGSSDGARMLLALNELWQAGWPSQKLSDFAARFGSDLSFFFHGPSSICSGRGEQVRQVDRPAAQWAVLVLPAFAVSTAEAYRRFDELGLGSARDIAVQPNWRDWAALPARKLMGQLVNDLEPAAFAIVPELGRLRANLEQSLGQIVRMSGSGSSLFTLSDDQPEAVAAAEQIRNRHGTCAWAVEVAPDFRDDLHN